MYNPFKAIAKKAKKSVIKVGKGITKVINQEKKQRIDAKNEAKKIKSNNLQRAIKSIEYLFLTQIWLGECN